jgi:GNAT superfamily N-acetyltransferase
MRQFLKRIWKKEQIASLVDKFHEGQIAIEVNGELAGCAFSIMVKYEEFANHHTYEEITGDYTFNTHSKDGNILYGIDVFVKPKFRGMRLGRRLYDYRKELCENLNLKGIAFGGRQEIHDPVLNFQISNDFHPSKILKGYLEGDRDSGEFAVLLEWDNIYYQKPSKIAKTKKKVVRLGLI